MKRHFWSCERLSLLIFRKDDGIMSTTDSSSGFSSTVAMATWTITFPLSPVQRRCHGSDLRQTALSLLISTRRPEREYYLQEGRGGGANYTSVM